MKYIKRIIIYAYILAVALLLASCGNNSDSTFGKNEYNIYYLKKESKTLYPVVYEAENTDADLLADELIEQLMTAPKSLDVSLTMNDKVTYMKHSIEDNILYLYFDSNYGSMKAEDEILCRAALAKTLTQIEGIDYISIYTGEAAITDTQGNPIGLIAASDFIESISDVNSYERIELKLYFADESGERLVEEDRSVMSSINTSKEKLIIDELMKGTRSSSLKATLPADSKLLNISVSDNVCYVNFDESFLLGVGDVQGYVTIYSIVNSLTDLSSVSKVQISANGIQNVNLKDSISLNTVFERNLDYIGEN